MANLYGVANAPGLPVVVSSLNTVAIAISTATQTLIGTSPALVAPSQGYFYCRVDIGLILLHGATPATGINVYVAIGAGSFTNPVSQGTFGQLGNSYVPLFFCTYTPVSQVAWQGAGSTVSVGMNVGVNAATVQPYSWAMFTLMRAPDQ